MEVYLNLPKLALNQVIRIYNHKLPPVFFDGKWNGGNLDPPFFAKDLVQIILQMDSQRFSLVDGASTLGKAKGKQNNAVRVAWPFGGGGCFRVARGRRVGSHGRVHGDMWFFISMLIVGFVPFKDRGCGTPFQMAELHGLEMGGKPHPNHLDSTWDDPPR